MTDINYLTRIGQNPCAECGRPKEMYYCPWCPICDKPKVESVPELNFIKALNHLEAIGHDGIKDRLMKFYTDDIRNDTGFWANFEEDEDTDEDERLTPDQQILKSTFDIGDGCNLYVSW